VGTILVQDQALEDLIGRWCADLEALVSDDLVIIGIRTGGEALAEQALLHLRAAGKNVDFGLLDIALYRDDHGLRTGVPRVLGTDIPHDIDDREILLVDDVFYTGRTIRAALSRLSDLGRPRCVRLATLARRPGHQVPISPDVVGIDLTDPGRSHRVSLDLTGRRLTLEDGQR
jgi:pyrimidine operon attenuation protein/uracil phosphoribosyltransferase